jgi:hypothetical protein
MKQYLNVKHFTSGVRERTTDVRTESCCTMTGFWAEDGVFKHFGVGGQETIDFNWQMAFLFGIFSIEPCFCGRCF